ncbi:MAG: C1 family peptidase [Propionibacteriaceae bacterium]|jgi:bleomycin hydrolase|nr:C1 family peptidase [Propionibacteriaceae bacterium]
MNNSSISIDQVAQLRIDFLNDKAARLSQNAITVNPISQVALDHAIVAAFDPSVNHRVDYWPVTNQKKSGRCWLFAGLNFLKQHVIEELKVDTFEFSQTYLHFWDKFEKCNWFLTAMIEMADRPLDDRTIATMLAGPNDDGGQWDMFVSLVEKYGVVPKYAMPETESSSNTAAMNKLLKTFLRRAALELRSAVSTAGDVEALRLQFVAQAYRILSIHLGTPPTKFIWQWSDKDRVVHGQGEMTPQEFAKQYIKVDLADYVALVHDPRQGSSYGEALTVDHLGNVVGGRATRYINAEIATIKGLVKQALVDGQAVWFGCDVNQQFDRTNGLWDAAIYDYEGTLGVALDMTKAERMESGESAMTHAMVFTGVDIQDEQIRRFRVENSWGDDRADKGFDTMNDSWFDEYVFEVALPQSALPAELAKALTATPRVLPLWDPLGALA